VSIDGDTIRGQLKYDLQNNAVQVNTRNVMQTYSARKIHYFEIFDETIDSYRHFYALPYSVQANYEVPLIFEVLYEGQLSLLCREEVVTEAAPQYNAYPLFVLWWQYFQSNQSQAEISVLFFGASGQNPKL
jgi:hypothetical protein